MHSHLVSCASTGDNPAQVAALRDHVLEVAVRDFDASFGAEHGIGHANQAAYDEPTPVAVQTYWAAVAAVFARIPAASVRFRACRIREERLK